MTGQPTTIGPFLITTRRQRGGYVGLVGRQESLAGGVRYAVHCTAIFRGQGAKDRAFQAARQWTHKYLEQ